MFGFLAVADPGDFRRHMQPRVYQRISPWLQTIAMCAMVGSVLLFPVYFLAVTYLPVGHAQWAWWIPAYWFGESRRSSRRTRSAQAALGALGLRLLGLALAVFGASWALGFARHYRQTLEAEVPAARRRTETEYCRRAAGIDQLGRFTTSPARHWRAARNTGCFLATYLTAGVSLGLMVSITVDGAGLEYRMWDCGRCRADRVSLLVSGFRRRFSFPRNYPQLAL